MPTRGYAKAHGFRFSGRRYRFHSIDYCRESLRVQLCRPRICHEWSDR